MSSDADWVEDVKRWYYSSVQSVAPVDASASFGSSESAALGYEAANPSLQARHWPDVPAPRFSESL